MPGFLILILVFVVLAVAIVFICNRGKAGKRAGGSTAPPAVTAVRTPPTPSPPNTRTTEPQGSRLAAGGPLFYPALASPMMSAMAAASVPVRRQV